MNTKIWMIVSTVFMGFLGLICTFLPQELLGMLTVPEDQIVILLIQIIGALYIGFAAFNWQLRSTPMGGIYGRPVVMANFFHFLIASIPILRTALESEASSVLWFLGVGYGVFALGFGWILFKGNPTKKQMAV